MNRTLRLPMLGLFACLAASPAARAALPDREMLQKADRARGHPAGVAWRVVVEERGQGRVQTSEYAVQSKGWNSLVEFLAPAQTKGRKLLMVERNMWFMRPGLSRPVPISPRQRLMGNAANGDLASTSYGLSYDIVKSWDEKVDEADCRAFELQANSSNTTYDRIKYWVSTSDIVGVKAEFYTVSGKLLKSARFEHANVVSLEGATRPFISRMVITDPHDSAAVTTLSFRNPQLVRLPDSTFNLNLVLQ